MVTSWSPFGSMRTPMTRAPTARCSGPARAKAEQRRRAARSRPAAASSSCVLSAQRGSPRARARGLAARGRRAARRSRCQARSAPVTAQSTTFSTGLVTVRTTRSSAVRSAGLPRVGEEDAQRDHERGPPRGCSSRYRFSSANNTTPASPAPPFLENPCILAPSRPRLFNLPSRRPPPTESRHRGSVRTHAGHPSGEEPQRPHLRPLRHHHRRLRGQLRPRLAGAARSRRRPRIGLGGQGERRTRSPPADYEEAYGQPLPHLPGSGPARPSRASSPTSSACATVAMNQLVERELVVQEAQAPRPPRRRRRAEPGGLGHPRLPDRRDASTSSSTSAPSASAYGSPGNFEERLRSDLALPEDDGPPAGDA